MAQSAQKITPASEFCRNFGRYKDEAISKGAVEVSSNGRPAELANVPDQLQSTATASS